MIEREQNLDGGIRNGEAVNIGGQSWCGTWRGGCETGVDKFFHRRHRGPHLPDFYTPNFATQALAPAIHYRYSPVKYGNVLHLVYFNFLL